MNQPNPWILFMGGIALLNVAFMMGGAPWPSWARYAAMATCAVVGVLAMGLGLQKQFQKKPERPKFVPKRRSGAESEPRA